MLFNSVEYSNDSQVRKISDLLPPLRCNVESCVYSNGIPRILWFSNIRITELSDTSYMDLGRKTIPKQSSFHVGRNTRIS